MNRWDSTPVIRFFGGRKTLFLLGILLMTGLNILVFSNVWFIFEPVAVFVKTAALPLILSIVGYYLLRPVINLLEKWRIKRIWGILLTLLVLVGLITLVIVLIIPFLEKQLISLSEELPRYIVDLISSMDEWLKNSYFSSYYTNMFQDVDGMIDQVPDYISSYATQTVGRDHEHYFHSNQCRCCHRDSAFYSVLPTQRRS